jgi:dTDP-glucose pyrophosphorylase
MKNWEDTLITQDTSLRDALLTIDKTGCQLALVTGENRQLLGTLSDGDVRRALLKGVVLTDKVALAMYRDPTSASTELSRYAILQLMRMKGLRHIPLLDQQQRVVGLETLEDFLHTTQRDNWVVIMAGGLGSRLNELTQETPKPMLMVGSRPLLETIVRNFADQGFRKFYFAVNYKAEKIEAHFGNGRLLNVEINYLREDKRMGTAGALSLLPQRPDEPVLVTNADLLTQEDFGLIIDQHLAHGVDATMAVRDHEIQVPFGVIRERNGLIEGIEEKPVQRFTVSAGIYVLSPHVLDLVPPNQYMDMPSLFDSLTHRGLRAQCHRIHGYWLDIGRPPDYERAQQEFSEVFQ